MQETLQKHLYKYRHSLVPRQPRYEARKDLIIAISHKLLISFKHNQKTTCNLLCNVYIFSFACRVSL